MDFFKQFIVIKFLLLFITDIKPQSTDTFLDLQPPNPEEDTDVRFSYFDKELLELFSRTPGNLLISPASIKTTLALILEGATNNSALEISNALRIEKIDQIEIREIFNTLLSNLNDRTPNIILEVASSVFVSNKYSVIPEFEKTATFYGTTVQSLDFSNSNEAENIVNSWVNNATHGLIQQIIEEKSIENVTTLAIANALYFKGKWKTAFDRRDTTAKCFYSRTSGCVIIPMMQLTDTFNYNFDANLYADVVELPYQDDKYAMLILLPREDSDVRTLAKDLQHTRLNDIISNLKPTEFLLEMPRFAIEYSVDLVQFLKKLAIREIFGTDAHLSGIVDQDTINSNIEEIFGENVQLPGIVINNFIHKARIEVTEQGAKASTAADVISLMGLINMRLDRPFIFFIYHKESKNIVFQSILEDPLKPLILNDLKTDNFQYYNTSKERTIKSELRNYTRRGQCYSIESEFQRVSN